MRREFEDYRKAISWIAQNAISQLHLFILREELIANHRQTGQYYVHTIIWN